MRSSVILISTIISAAIIAVPAMGSSINVNIPVPNPSPFEYFEMDVLSIKGDSVTQKQHVIWDLVYHRSLLHFDKSPEFSETMTQVSRYDLGYQLLSSGDTKATFQCANMSLSGHLDKFWTFPEKMTFLGPTVVFGTPAYTWEFTTTAPTSTTFTPKKEGAYTTTTTPSVWDTLLARITTAPGEVMQYSKSRDNLHPFAPLALMNMNTSTGYQYTNYFQGHAEAYTYVIPEMMRNPDWKCTSVAP